MKTITVKDFLAEFEEDLKPQKMGPWISFEAHDPAWTRAELRSMRKQGVIELDEPGRQYRIIKTDFENKKPVNRGHYIDTMMRIPHNLDEPMYQIWEVFSSNGVKLCECKTESSAKKIKKALDSFDF